VGGNTTAEFKRLRRAWYAGEGDHACPTGGKLLSPCNTGPACFMGAREISSLSPISHHSLLTLVSQLHHNYIKMKKTPASSRAMILQHSQHHPNLEPSHASFCSVMYKVILLLSLCNQITHQEEKDSSVCMRSTGELSTVTSAGLHPSVFSMKHRHGDCMSKDLVHR
jgi:hypothetical protein